MWATFLLHKGSLQRGPQHQPNSQSFTAFEGSKLCCQGVCCVSESWGAAPSPSLLCLSSQAYSSLLLSLLTATGTRALTQNIHKGISISLLPWVSLLWKILNKLGGKYFPSDKSKRLQQHTRVLGVGSFLVFFAPWYFLYTIYATIWFLVPSQHSFFSSNKLLCPMYIRTLFSFYYPSFLLHGKGLPNHRTGLTFSFLAGRGNPWFAHCFSLGT